MAFAIDRTTYNKPSKYPLRYGYQMRNTQPSSIVVHSTSNPTVKNTAFAAEARFLLNSSKVSAHYLVGKSGQIAQFLDARRYQAWHVGEAKAAWINAKSIGIELHHSVGDAPYPTIQKAALSWLVRELMRDYDIPLALVETHRAVATPKGRKSDPHDWSDPFFYAWRDKLLEEPMARLWVVTSEIGVNIRSEPNATAEKLTALPKGKTFHGNPVQGAAVQGNATWVARLPSEGGGYAWSGAVQEVK